MDETTRLNRSSTCTASVYIWRPAEIQVLMGVAHDGNEKQSPMRAPGNHKRYTPTDIRKGRGRACESSEKDTRAAAEKQRYHSNPPYRATILLMTKMT